LDRKIVELGNKKVAKRGKVGAATTLWADD